MDCEDLTIVQIGPEALVSPDQSDEWLAEVAALLRGSTEECSGEPAVGMWLMRDSARVVGCASPTAKSS